MSVLETCVRDDLNRVAPRRMAVLDPLKLVLVNWPAGVTLEDAHLFLEFITISGTVAAEIPVTVTLPLAYNDPVGEWTIALTDLFGADTEQRVTINVE